MGNLFSNRTILQNDNNKVSEKIKPYLDNPLLQRSNSLSSIIETEEDTQSIEKKNYIHKNKISSISSSPKSNNTIVPNTNIDLNNNFSMKEELKEYINLSVSNILNELSKYTNEQANIQNHLIENITDIRKEIDELKNKISKHLNDNIIITQYIEKEALNDNNINNINEQNKINKCNHNIEPYLEYIEEDYNSPENQLIRLNNKNNNAPTFAYEYYNGDYSEDYNIQSNQSNSTIQINNQTTV